MKAMLVGFVLTALTIGTLSDVSATFLDGNNLIPLMKEYEKAERRDPSTNLERAGRFMGYVTGVADALAEILWCSDSAMGGQPTVRQFGAIVAKYINEHPDQWHFPAHLLVGRALKETFPCKESQ